jgi:ABC-type sugar transport system substrate-binding protein
VNSKEKRFLNRKEKNAFNLELLTEQAKRKFIGRREFMKGGMALGLTATSALLLFQACGGDDPTAVPPTSAPATAASSDVAPGATTAPPPTSAPAVEVDGENLDHLVRRLPELQDVPLKVAEMWPPLDGKSTIYCANLLVHPFHVSSSANFKTEAERLNMEYTVVDAAFDPAKEVENIELGISRGMDAILYASVDPAAGIVAIRRQRETGRIFFNWDNPSFARPNIFWLLPHYRIGYMAGEWMSEQLPPGSKVFTGVGDLVTQAGSARTNGFLDAVEDRNAGFEILAAEAGHGWSQEGGYQMGRSLFSRFPDLQGIWGGDDQGALGIQKAALDAGRREEVLIVGAEGLKEGQDAVWDGRLDMSNMTRRGHGPEAAMAFLFVEAMLRGNVHGDALEGMHSIRRVNVTKENIGEQWVSTV